MTQNEANQNPIYDHIMENYIIPEVERRQGVGTAPVPFKLMQAQVVYPPDFKQPKVRLNDEIVGTMEFIVSEGVELKPGSPVNVGDVEEVEAFSLDPNEDSDCGHITMIAVKSGWRIWFDFRRNRELAKRHLGVAREFLETSRGALKREHYAPLVDNLFSACELAAKAHMLAFSDTDFRIKATHSAIKSKYNKAAVVGNVNDEHSSALNQLSGLRKSARYLRSDLSIGKEKAEELFSAVEEMIESVQEFYREGTV